MFDYKAAYDSVDREILYQRLERTKALSEQQVSLLKFIYNNIRITLGNSTITTSKGVPQGLCTSPILFNLYSQPILYELQSAGIFARMYADDLICICKDKVEAGRAISITARVSNALKLKLNPKKSGILMMFSNQPRKPAEGHIGGIPYTQYYKYLGTTIDRTFSAKPHLAKTGHRAAYISRQLWNCRN